VETVFYAVYNTSNKIGERAAEVQNRSVISHIAQLVRHMFLDAAYMDQLINDQIEFSLMINQLSCCLQNE
jgi:hypothetical protein